MPYFVPCPAAILYVHFFFKKYVQLNLEEEIKMVQASLRIAYTRSPAGLVEKRISMILAKNEKVKKDGDPSSPYLESGKTHKSCQARRIARTDTSGAQTVSTNASVSPSVKPTATYIGRRGIWSQGALHVRPQDAERLALALAPRQRRIPLSGFRSKVGSVEPECDVDALLEPRSSVADRFAHPFGCLR